MYINIYNKYFHNKKNKHLYLQCLNRLFIFYIMQTGIIKWARAQAKSSICYIKVVSVSVLRYL